MEEVSHRGGPWGLISHPSCSRCSLNTDAKQPTCFLLLHFSPPEALELETTINLSFLRLLLPSALSTAKSKTMSELSI